MAWAYGSDWRAVRASVLARDRLECQLHLVGCTGRAEHVDHIIPLSEGGARLDPTNLRASCRHCNLSRNGSRAAQLSAAFAGQVGASPSRRW